MRYPPPTLIPIDRNTSKKHTPLLWSNQGALIDKPGPGASVNRTEWEKPGNSLDWALWGHFHSDAHVSFTGYFLRPQWEASQKEDSFPSQ